MSNVRVWIHAVWGTKNKVDLLTDDVRQNVLSHIRVNARQKSIYIDRLNGYTDHLHCLFRLDADMTIAKALQLMKGEASFWVNKERLTRGRFEWANEYYAASVSESALARVRAYIDKQDEHHRKRTFGEEVEEFLGQSDGLGHG